LIFSRFPNFTDSGLDVRRFVTSRPRRFKIQIFADSQLQGFAGSRFQIFAGLRLQGFTGSIFQIFVDSRLRGLAGSIFQIFIDSTSLRTYFMNSVKPDVLRVTDFFLNSPTLTPRGSGLTLTIQFHKKL
jgi:hypothetical protein